MGVDAAPFGQGRNFVTAVAVVPHDVGYALIQQFVTLSGGGLLGETSEGTDAVLGVILTVAHEI